MDWNTLSIALIAGLLSPMLLAYFTGRQRRAEKLEDYIRQDQVAERAARAVVAVAQVGMATNSKLEVIHGLVNSSLTSAMQSEHDAIAAQLILLKELTQIRKDAGKEPSTETISALGALEAKLAELTIHLAERAKQAEVAAAQVKSGEAQVQVQAVEVRTVDPANGSP